MSDDGESLQTPSEASSSDEDMDDFVVEDDTDVGDITTLLDDEEMVVLPADSEDDFSTADSGCNSSNSSEADSQSMTPTALRRKKEPIQTPNIHQTTIPQVKDEAVANLPTASATNSRELIDLTMTSSDDAAPKKKELFAKLLKLTDQPSRSELNTQSPSVNLVTPPKTRAHRPPFVSPSLDRQTVSHRSNMRLKAHLLPGSTDDEDEEPRSAHRREQTKQ
jgi:hypothetical protein